MPDILPLVIEVRPGASDFALAVAFDTGAAGTVDLTGAIWAFPPYAPLREAAVFRAVAVTDDGTGIEWPASGLDMSASTLLSILQAQAPWNQENFQRWQEHLGLSLQETADLLGRSLATIKNYRSGTPIPPAVKIACLAIERDPHLFQALYRPRHRGRPRNLAAHVMHHTPDRGRNVA